MSKNHSDYVKQEFVRPLRKEHNTNLRVLDAFISDAIDVAPSGDVIKVIDAVALARRAYDLGLRVGQQPGVKVLGIDYGEAVTGAAVVRYNHAQQCYDKIDLPEHPAGKFADVVAAGSVWGVEVKPPIREPKPKPDFSAITKLLARGS